MKLNKLACSLLIIAIGCSVSSQAQIDQIESYYSMLEKQSKSEPTTIQFVQEELDLVQDYSELCQIILLRHGEPALKKKGWRKRKDAMKYIRAYDSVRVYPPTYLPVMLETGDLDKIYTSIINRSVSTSEQLFQRPEDHVSDSIFREFERKIFSFPNIKLPLKWWLTVSRSLWFMGLNKKGIERFSKAKERASEAAVILENNATENGKTLLVSHGLINHFLVKYLKKNGWTEVYDGGKGYLSQKLLVKIK